MRVPGILGGNNLALTHIFSRRIPRTFHHPRSVSTPPPFPFIITRMASDNGSPEWTAQKVRETFLDFFKQNGHTFGGFDPAIAAILTPPPSIDLTDLEIALPCSPVLPGGPPVRSDAIVHKCGNESVQVHLFGHSGPPVRICKVTTRGQLAKGNRTNATAQFHQ